MNTEYIKHYIVLDDGETYCELNDECLVVSVNEEGQKFIDENGDSIKSLITYENRIKPLFSTESLTQYLKMI
jgi:hypothetical protein